MIPSFTIYTIMANPYQRAIFVLRQISKMILFEWWKNINEMFKTMFKSIYKFRICSYFMYLKVLIGNNVRLYFWKFSQIKNRTLVRMSHYCISNCWYMYFFLLGTSLCRIISTKLLEKLFNGVVFNLLLINKARSHFRRFLHIFMLMRFRSEKFCNWVQYAANSHFLSKQSKV